ncbi:type II toxin-antitoxin system RelE/ParE family toxin [Sphingobium yanoikuyae]|uniref:Type II toxin-antitoxin system RelE/ParE family toxin n=1 Tax=Sphingobium yanoikuyae TaxID=13690 RepID=A0A6P1GPE1_SPHYA|nr:type II toxin-antitoxin system RelE/ParE family toxin [Sphingobium yanoikuyae]
MPPIFATEPPEYREKLIAFGNSGYVALYRLDGDVVAILAVRHQKESGYP